MMEQICSIRCLVSFVWGSRMDEYKILDIPYLSLGLSEPLGTKQNIGLMMENGYLRRAETKPLKIVVRKLLVKLQDLYNYPVQNMNSENLLIIPIKLLWGLLAKVF